MADITIPLPSPAVRPAVTEKTFGQIYILELTIQSARMDASDQIYIRYCPFDKASGDRLLSDQREMRIPFWEAVAAVPEAGAAFAAVAAAVPALIAYTTPAPEPVPDPEPDPE